MKSFFQYKGGTFIQEYLATRYVLITHKPTNHLSRLKSSSIWGANGFAEKDIKARVTIAKNFVW